MKREAVNTSFLLAITCLLVYVAVLLTQKPSLQDIDARIEYWHKYYDVQLKRVRKERPDEVESGSDSDSESDAEITSADYIGNRVSDPPKLDLEAESDSGAKPVPKPDSADEKPQPAGEG